MWKTLAVVAAYPVACFMVGVVWEAMRPNLTDQPQSATVEAEGEATP
jgi:hypothetical protein